MMRKTWTSAAALLAVSLLAAGCGGGSKESFLAGIDPTPDPNVTPGPQGDAAVIEFVVPVTTGGAAAAQSDIGFEPSIGPAGSSNPQASLIRFRVLNAQGRPARNGIRVFFSLEGPADATLTALEDRTDRGFVATILRAGSLPGNATVVARVRDTNLVARSTAVVIGRPRGAAASIEFFGLRVPGLLGEQDDNAGTPTTRTQLGVRGSGFNQAVDVVFAVLDTGGAAALDNSVVDFRLFGPNGGESISPTTGFTNDGFVSATITTGTRPGPVQVEARVRGTALFARAIPITIGTALNPPQVNFSIAFECLNIAGKVLFGIRDEIRAGFSDQFNNQIPLGSAVSFFTEGGAIQAQGISDDGFEAVADLISQLPVPANGRVTVLAVTTGQESFTDQNGNGQFDAGEPFVDQPNEVFLDANENGTWEPGEFFIDNNNNGVFDATPNGQWDDQILISRSGVVVFSGSPVISLDPTTFALTEAMPTQCFTLNIADTAGNPLVGGTTVTFQVTGGVEVIPGSITIPDTNIDTSGGPVPGITQFQVCLAREAQAQPSPAPSAAPPQPQPASLTVEVEGGGGGGTQCPGSNGGATLTIFGAVE